MHVGMATIFQNPKKSRARKELDVGLLGT